MVFDTCIIQSMENVWNMEWKKFSMELNGRFRWIWNIKNFHSIPFHSIACPACHSQKIIILLKVSKLGGQLPSLPPSGTVMSLYRAALWKLL